MTAKRLTIRGLRVIGDGRPPAEVAFAPGLNVIVGASDTGKTFIFEALDFMLGAGAPLRRIPESIGYDRVFLDGAWIFRSENGSDIPTFKIGSRIRLITNGM